MNRNIANQRSLYDRMFYKEGIFQYLYRESRIALRLGTDFVIGHQRFFSLVKKEEPSGFPAPETGKSQAPTSADHAVS